MAWQPPHALVRVPSALITPNRASLSLFGPAVKKRVLVAPTIPLPNFRLHSPSMTIGLPRLASSEPIKAPVLASNALMSPSPKLRECPGPAVIESRLYEWVHHGA